MSFVRIRRYTVGSAVGSVDTYEEYLKDDCDMLILLYDGGFYEIYAKDESLSENMYK